MKKPFTRIAAVVFGIVAVAHLLRVIFHISLIIGGLQVPPWVNVIAALIAGFLAAMLLGEIEYPQSHPEILSMKINSLLRIKYGLVHDPSEDAMTQHWHTQFLALREKGLNSEEAGYEAAKNEFVDFEHVNYASQANTIEAVLGEMRRQHK